MSKIFIPPYELELRSEDHIQILWNEGACKRSIGEFKNLEHILSSKEKIYLLPNKNLLNSHNTLEWFKRLVDYNYGILEEELLIRFLTEKGFQPENGEGFGIKSVIKWFNKVEDYITIKHKYEGYGFFY
jgi:hypothetical protein